MRRVLVVLAALAALAGMTACQPGRTMYTPCDPAAQGGDITGTDGTYVLVCRQGEWVPIMTIAEYLAMRRGQHVTIAPVPARPAPPATASTAPPSTEPTTTVAPSAQPNPVAVSAGGSHTCALLENHTVSCWGANSAGQLGRDTNVGTTVANYTPGAVGGLTDVSAVAAGGFHTCALQRSGSVQCWGLNSDGQLGRADNAGSGAANPVPAAVPGLDDAVALSAGTAHTCAVRSGGTVACWGSNDRGQLGSTTNVGTGDATTTPVEVTAIKDAVAVTAAGDHTCVVLADHTVTCFGSNTFGENGNGTSNTEDAVNPTPTAVAGIGTAVAVAGGEDHTCVLLEDHTVTCFGSNRFGQLGNQATSGAFGANPEPTAADNVTEVTGITAGGFHTCVVRQDHSVACWGDNRFGELGNSTANGTGDAGPQATTLDGITEASQVSAGQLHTCMLVADTVRCMGSNAHGELGRADNAGSAQAANPSPAPVVGLS